MIINFKNIKHGWLWLAVIALVGWSASHLPDPGPDPEPVELVIPDLEAQGMEVYRGIVHSGTNWETAVANVAIRAPGAVDVWVDNLVRMNFMSRPCHVQQAEMDALSSIVRRVHREPMDVSVMLVGSSQPFAWLDRGKNYHCP